MPNNLAISITTVNEMNSKYKYNISNCLDKAKKMTKIKVYCIYRRNPYLYILPPSSTVEDIKKKFSTEISVELNQLSFKINGTPLATEKNKMKIKDILLEEKTNQIFATKLQNEASAYLSDIYIKSYNNLVLVEQVQNIEKLVKKIDEFLEKVGSQKDYIIKKSGDGNYSFGFNYPDLAFDINRLIIALKARSDDSEFSQIKSQLKVANNKKYKNSCRNLKYHKLLDGIKKNKEDYGLYVTMDGQYDTYEHSLLLQGIQNKKKWLTKKGFIFK